MPHRIFNLNEVADYLHLGPQDVQRLVRSGEIPYEKSGDRLLFRKREIAQWASQRLLGFDAKSLEAFHATSSARDRKAEDRDWILPELLKPSHVQVDLAARTRSAVIRQMVKLADATDLVNYPEDLLEGVLAREELCSTAMKNGFALMHPRNHEPYMFEASFIVLARTVNPLPFGAPDGGTTDLFALLCCGDDRLHLHALARLSTLLSDADLREDLRYAETGAELHTLLLDAEEKLPKRK